MSSPSPALASIFFTADLPGKPLKQECSGGDIPAGYSPAFVAVGGGLKALLYGCYSVIVSVLNSRPWMFKRLRVFLSFKSPDVVI